MPIHESFEYAEMKVVTKDATMLFVICECDMPMQSMTTLANKYSGQDTDVESILVGYRVDFKSFFDARDKFLSWSTIPFLVLSLSSLQSQPLINDQVIHGLWLLIAHSLDDNSECISRSWDSNLKADHVIGEFRKI